MNLRPLWTAIVCPTISGTTVDRRDQVLMTFLSPPRFITSTFSSSGTSTNGPFFSDLDITFSSFQRSARSRQLLRPPRDDETVRRLAVARLVSLGRLTPRRDRVAAAGRLAFTAAERVIDRVHRHAADVRPLAQPPAPAGL